MARDDIRERLRGSSSAVVERVLAGDEEEIAKRIKRLEVPTDFRVPIRREDTKKR